jgi:hypothetical protein
MDKELEEHVFLDGVAANAATRNRVGLKEGRILQAAAWPRRKAATGAQPAGVSGTIRRLAVTCAQASRCGCYNQPTPHGSTQFNVDSSRGSVVSMHRRRFYDCHIVATEIESDGS